MAKKYKVINVCDRCEREEEAEVMEITVESLTNEGGDRTPDWQFHQRFDVANLEEGHPMSGQKDGSFHYLCGKCKLRIADLTALIYNRPLPKRRAKAEEATPLLLEQV